MPKIQTTCPECGAVFEIYPSQLKKSKRVHCSRGCAGACRSREMKERWQDDDYRREMAQMSRDSWTEERHRKHIEQYSGEKNPAWVGGSYIEPNKGYVMIRCPDDFQTMARQNGYVLEHRLVMARHLDRPLEAQEVVHHVNGDIQDNRLANLKLYPNHRAHYVQEHAAEIAAENHRTGRTASYHLRKKR